MGKKLIEVKHYVRDNECMWAGIEDLYSERLGEILPPFFFFTISGTGNFTYEKREQYRRAVWSNVRVKDMYDFMGPIAGFTYEHKEGMTFEDTMCLAKKEIDEGRTVILGPTDLYYLSYFPRLYKQVHIPIHYLMMVGYDEEQIYLIDGGVEGIQAITYKEMEEALNVEKTELGDKNGIYLLHLPKEMPTMVEIAKKGFYQKAKNMLEPKSKHEGIRAMRKLALEFVDWKKELAPENYLKVLQELVVYAGTVPEAPMRLFGKQDKKGIYHRAARENLVAVLGGLGEKYQVNRWLEAARLFEKSGLKIEVMVNQIVDYLLGLRKDLEEVSQIILEIAEIEEKAYEQLMIRV